MGIEEANPLPGVLATNPVARPLQPGSTRGAYAVTAKIGGWGMVEVQKADRIAHGPIPVDEALLRHVGTGSVPDEILSKVVYDG